METLFREAAVHSSGGLVFCFALVLPTEYNIDGTGRSLRDTEVSFVNCKRLPPVIEAASAFGSCSCARRHG